MNIFIDAKSSAHSYSSKWTTPCHTKDVKSKKRKSVAVSSPCRWRGGRIVLLILQFDFYSRYTIKNAANL